MNHAEQTLHVCVVFNRGINCDHANLNQTFNADRMLSSTFQNGFCLVPLFVIFFFCFSSCNVLISFYKMYKCWTQHVVQ